MDGVGIADHGKQRVILRLAVDDPTGVEDLVTTVFGVNVGKHDQLDIGWIPLQLVGIRLEEVVDLIVSQGQPHLSIRRSESISSLLNDFDRLQMSRINALKQEGRIIDDGLCHTVVQQREQRRQGRGVERRGS